jgi:hypothetical protein
METSTEAGYQIVRAVNSVKRVNLFQIYGDFMPLLQSLDELKLNSRFYHHYFRASV